MNTGSEILPLMVKSKSEPENDFGSSMSTATSVEAQESKDDSASTTTSIEAPEALCASADNTPQPPLKSFAGTLWRTRYCKHFQKGTCRFGDKCGFAHSDETNDRPDLVKTRLCSRFQKGSCKKGENCKFAHGLSQLKVLDAPHKMPPTLKMNDNKIKNQKGTEKEPQKFTKSLLDEDPRKVVPLSVEPMKCALQPMSVRLTSTTGAPLLTGLHNSVMNPFAVPERVPQTRLQQSGKPYACPEGMYRDSLETNFMMLNRNHWMETNNMQANIRTMPNLGQPMLAGNTGVLRAPPGLENTDYVTSNTRFQQNRPSSGQPRMEIESLFADIWADDQ
jgi:hypothetical protein